MPWRLATLGPQGTDHERAASHYSTLRNLGDHKLHLLADFDAAIPFLYEQENSLVVANAAHPDVDLLTTRHWEEIGIVDVFVMSTMPLALVRRHGCGDGGSIALMPSTRGYVDLSRWAHVEYVAAKPLALERVLSGRADAAIVSLSGYTAHTGELALDQRLGPVECCWIVFSRRTVAPTSILAPAAPWFSPRIGEHGNSQADDGGTGVPEVPRLREIDLAALDLPPMPPRHPVHRLGLNEVPYPPLQAVVDAVAESVSEGHRYPDADSRTLVDMLAGRLEVIPSEVIIASGIVALGRALIRAAAAPGDEVIFPWPSFDDYPLDTILHDATPIQAPLRDDKVDLHSMLSRIGPRTRLIIVCNPNNPTGTALGTEELTQFIGEVPPMVLIGIDEAYHEFTDPTCVADGLTLFRRYPNVCVLRTFSKAYGLAGLRVGYAIAAPRVIRVLANVLQPFAVSRPAQAAAVAALRSTEHYQRRVAKIVAERKRLTGQLRLQGWEVTDSQANFVWLRVGQRASEVAEALADAGIAVRPYPAAGVRITVGTPEQSDLLLAQTAQLSAAGAQ